MYSGSETALYRFISSGLLAGCAHPGFDSKVSPLFPAQNSSQKPSRMNVGWWNVRSLRIAQGAHTASPSSAPHAARFSNPVAEGSDVWYQRYIAISPAGPSTV